MLRPALCLAACALLSAQGAPKKLDPKDLPELPAGALKPGGLQEVKRVDLPAEYVGSPEALTSALYAFISGGPGEKRDVERIRSLFHATARLTVAARHPEQGPFMRPMDLEAFLKFAVPQWEKGFFEKGLAMSVQKQEGLAQVWSTYEIRLAKDAPVAYTGINALQCVFDGKRWWIMHLAFQSQAAK